MGWSCSAAADDVERAWTKACRESTGLANVYQHGEKMVDIESDWGGKTLYILRTPEGALLKAFHSGGALRTKDGRQLDIGDTAVVKATVKKHGEYKGQKETIVNRIAVNGE